MPVFARQVEELVLLRCSLLPDEILEFIFSSPEDVEEWSKLVDAGTEGEVIPTLNVCSAHFAVKIHGTPLWFEFKLSHEYPLEPSAFQVMVRGYDVSRAEQQRWQDIVQEKRAQLNEVEFPLFHLVSVHLLPLLHAKFDAQPDHINTEARTSITQPEPPTYAHALLTSHHLKSPQKRRSLQQWSSELGLTGYAKLGHPGIIYCSGVQSDVAEFVSRVKDMQWLALRVRFEEPLLGAQVEARPRGSWLEFQKVGEVVQEMERLGRGKYVLDLGIGSGSR